MTSLWSTGISLSIDSSWRSVSPPPPPIVFRAEFLEVTPGTVTHVLRSSVGLGKTDSIWLFLMHLSTALALPDGRGYAKGATYMAPHHIFSTVGASIRKPVHILAHVGTLFTALNHSFSTRGHFSITGAPNWARSYFGQQGRTSCSKAVLWVVRSYLLRQSLTLGGKAIFPVARLYFGW